MILRNTLKTIRIQMIMATMATVATTLCALLLAPAPALALDDVVGADAASKSERVSSLIRRELGRKYPGARIEITGDPRVTRGAMPAELESVSVLSESAK